MMKMKFILLVFFVLHGSIIHGKDENRSDISQTKITVKPGSGTLQQAIRKAASIEGDVIIEMAGGEYRTDKTIEILPGNWHSLRIKSKKRGESLCFRR
ncbi:hypothetical protein NXY11_16180 [Parabacteroides faecis]|uniref:hypothetical protein n=1 Tax=Parabacteroides faecis TaxID=1217282 RepID=UPI0021645397|nr:hypothetical protein [Parabacteroides faecis]UVQ44728.1 hypothetical protein NXY11_16180 [Parabacteroides faecis]